MISRAFLLRLMVVLLGCGLLVRAADSGKRVPNIILITLDTTRADRIGALGSQKGLSPNLDALAKDGVVFDRAYAHVPLTTPSHANILTGTYPQFNQVHDLALGFGL